MSVVTVTFKLAATDEGDAIGLIEEDFIVVNDVIAQLGGYDLDFKKQVDGDGSN